jgi:hypothetical protein
MGAAGKAKVDPPKCCFMEDGTSCKEKAEFTLYAGEGRNFEDYTETCGPHISALLTDAYTHHIHQIEVVS